MRRGMVAAVVLGTALSALGTSLAEAAVATDTSVRTVNDISRYCTACWRNARIPVDSWNDCTQDVLTRLLERVSPEEWDQVLKVEGDERREFLRAIDAVKKRSKRQHKTCGYPVEDVADGHDLYGRGVAEERSTVTQAAAEVLSPRQQRILQLSFEGGSVNEIATELKTTPERVSDEKYKAIRKLREHLAQSDLD
jgi:RNA polymerase sigma factor (sigma-70 family)